MTTTLSEGVKVPDVGSVNWAGDLEVNWNLLNGALANLSGNVKLDRDNTWTGEQSFTLPIVGSITGTAAKAIADEDGTSIKTGYVNVAGNQTVTGNKEFTGSNTFNNILPNATNTYALGSSTYQWSSVYAQTYYYNGTAWGLDKENTWTATQTIKGAPPALNLQSTNIQRGVAPASNSNLNLYGKDLNGAELCRLLYRASPTGERRLWIGVNDNYSNGAISPTGSSTWNSLNLYLRADGQAETTFSADVLPETNNKYNLGTSTNKWKTLNGINPGALSLPDYNNCLDVTSEIPIASLDGNTQIDINNYLPNKTGWLSIVIADTAGNFIVATQGRSGGSTAYNNSRTFHTGAQSNGYISVFFPILADMNKFVNIKASSLIQMRFYYCLGNV